MPEDLRRLTADDDSAAWELGRLAFGDERTPPPGWGSERPGRRSWGVVDGTGRLLAKAVDREQHQWFGGRAVPTSGIAGVAVVPERRGTGLTRRVLTRLLADARDRGAVISTLFRTTPLPYRRLGWEEVGSLRWTAVPTAALAGPPVPGVELRQAGPDDVAGVLAAYRDAARAGTGLMERSGPLFDTSVGAVLAGHDGITVAVGPDGVDGYASWDRGRGYDAAARLTVDDLVARTAPALAGLLAVLGSWASVAPTVALRLPPDDPATLLAPIGGARVESDDPWMLRVVDAPGAVAARGWPAHLDATVDLHLDDDVCPGNAGDWRLVLGGGAGRLERGGAGRVRLGPRGLAAWYAGSASPAVLRRAGLLDGPDDADGLLLTATAGARPLRFDDGAPVRAASAVAPLGDGWLVAQDDSTIAAWRREGSVVPVRVFPPVDGLDVFGSAEGTKHLKPDVEAACAVAGGVLLLGSGSTAARMRGALVGLDGDPRTAALDAVYARVAAVLGVPLDGLNLEGACRVGGRLRWFQRGVPAAGVPSASVDVDLAGLVAAVTGTGAASAVTVESPLRYDLGAVDGVGLAVTDAVALPDGRLLLAAAAEDTPNAVDDGPVVGAALALVSGGALLAVTPLVADDGAVHKVEGLALRAATATGVELLAVVDADDPLLPSAELDVHVALRAS